RVNSFDVMSTILNRRFEYFGASTKSVLKASASWAAVSRRKQPQRGSGEFKRVGGLFTMPRQGQPRHFLAQGRKPQRTRTISPVWTFSAGKSSKITKPLLKSSARSPGSR